MARPLRLNVPDGIYHVTSRGLERRAIVRDDTDRRRWRDLLDAVATRCGWSVFAWVLMDTHYHLFLRIPNADLSRGMHDLNAGYVSAFNRRYRRSGPLLQGRFKAIFVEREYHYWELTRYIHLNPVRAGLIVRPDRYPWGSCAAYFDARLAAPWLAWEEVLIAHGASLRTARTEYMRFLLDSAADGARSPLEKAEAETLLGSESFVAKMKAWLGTLKPQREVPSARRLRPFVVCDDLVRATADVFGVSPESVRHPRQHDNAARDAAILLARKWTGLGVKEVGAALGSVSGQAISLVLAREPIRRRGAAFAARVARVEKLLRKKLNFAT